MEKLSDEKKIKLLEDFLKEHWRIHRELERVIELQKGDGALVECEGCGGLCRK